MGFRTEKNQATQYSSSSLDHNEPGASQVFLTDLEKKDLTYKSRIRTFRLINRLGSLILITFLIGSEAFALTKYYLTKDKVIAGTNPPLHPWATPVVLWPTFMMLAISIITFIMNFITICTYACGVKTANKTSSFASKVGYVMTAVHVIAWAASAGLFKMANKGDLSHDLWGYSCSSISDQLQNEVQSYLNFSRLCTLQTGSWYVSIVEVIVYGSTSIVTIMVWRRSVYKKKIEIMKSTLDDDYGHANSVEMENTYKDGKRYMPVSVYSTQL